MQPGAHRIGSTSGAGGLERVAFLNPDESRVLIVVNTAAGTRDFAAGSEEGWFRASLPVGAVATYRWP